MSSRVACLTVVSILSSLHAEAQESGGDVVIETAEIVLTNGRVEEYELGTLYVPEVRDDPFSREIQVGFARFPARNETTAPPIFHLPGGPGTSLLQRMNSGSARDRQNFLDGLESDRAISDVILVDQRGYSEAGDVLMSDFPVPPGTAQTNTSQQEEIDLFIAFTEHCVAAFAETEIDLAGYTVKECATDVYDLALALEYDKITLVGTSFGSQWSFAIMRMYPQIVARALLSGVEPLNHGYDMPSYVFAAIQRMWLVVDQDEYYQPYLPPGGMGEAAEAVIRKLEGPLVIQAEDGSRSVTLGPSDFPSRNPAAILALYHGHYDPWLEADDDSENQVLRRPLIGPLIDSSLSATPERRHLLWTDPATRYLTRGNFSSYLATAELWPSPDVGDELRTPVECEIPVLFAQGDWDLSTPIENTYEIAPYFLNSRVVIAKRGGHGVLPDLERQHPKVWIEVEDFLRTGDLDGIPSEVLLAPDRTFPPPGFDLPHDDGTPPAAR